MREYPPAFISGTPTLLTTPFSGTQPNKFVTSASGQTYGNGFYIMAASSAWTQATADIGYLGPWLLFTSGYSYSEEGASWLEYNYSPATGLFVGSSTAQYTLDGSYYGDWFSIDMPEPFILTRLTFLARANCCSERSPRLFKLYGSNNGVLWDVIHDQSASLTYTNFEGTVNVNNQKSYSFFAVVVSGLNVGATSNTLNFRRWRLHGRVCVQHCPPCLLHVCLLLNVQVFVSRDHAVKGLGIPHWQRAS